MSRILHFDCLSGVSGDMTLAALLDLGTPEDLVRQALGSLGLPGELVVAKVKRKGFAATSVTVQAPDEKKHRHLSNILRVLDAGDLTPGARALARAMFETLGAAEAASHGIPIEKVHFHEVGAIDSIFDFVGVAVAIDWLKPTRVTSAPPPTGRGWVYCDHGRLPVPPPAVAHLLTGVPLGESAIESELTTPTGAAILKTLVKDFGPLPTGVIQKVGCGAGARDFAEQANILRLFLLESAPTETEGLATDVVWQVETNLDNVTGEVIGYAVERLFEAGALDVFTHAIQMKKNRPGTLLTALCEPDRLAAVENVIFRETGALGVRRSLRQRSKLQRRSASTETSFGPTAVKIGWADGVRVANPEFEACAQLARERGVPLREVFQAALRQWEKQATPASDDNRQT